jgi:hypothetical protein
MVMTITVKRDISALIKLAKHTAQWIDEREKDFDFLSSILDKVDRGATITKKERRRARKALGRLKQ